MQTDGAPGVGYFLIGSRGTGDLVMGYARDIVNQIGGLRIAGPGKLIEHNFDLLWQLPL